MSLVFTLLKPRILSFTHRGLEKRRGIRILFFGTIGLAFWLGIYALSCRVLIYFLQVEDFGYILANKLLSMVLLTFTSLLIFSAILTSLTKLYLSRDLSLVHAMPVAAETLFISRWIEITVDSSWMVILYSIPIFMAYGYAFSTGMWFYAHMAVLLIPLCMIASALGTAMVMLVVLMLPASRIRSIVIFLGIIVLIVLYVAFRLLRPERLVNPETFATTMLYLNSINTPSSPFLPSTWAFDSLRYALSGNFKTALFHSALLWSGAVFLSLAVLNLSRYIYFKGFSKAQSAQIKPFRTSGQGLSNALGFLPGPIRAFIVKELKSFWRDQSQWSQLFLIGALIIIYIYNFSVLPLDKAPIESFYLQNLLSFLNMGLASLVLTAVAARFAFPAVSTEGNAFWIVRSSPVSIRTFLWIKYFVYLVPLLVLSEILIVFTNILLKVTPFIMALSIITLFCVTPAIIAMGIGLGAAFPDFNSENPVQSITSFGGLTFMILSAVLILGVISLEAGPVYAVFMSHTRGNALTGIQHIWTVLSFSTAFLISVLSVILPMKFGINRLETWAANGDAPHFKKNAV